MKRTKNNSVSFDEYLNEIFEEKGEKAYIAAIMAAAKKQGRPEAPSSRVLGRLSSE